MAEKNEAAKKPALSDTQKIGLGVGLTAAAVAAAGTYFLYGSKGASKNRKAVKSWMLKAKAEVLEKLEQAKEMSADEYMQLIDTVGGMYATTKDATRNDISSFKKEMKEHWNKIEKTARPKKKVVKKIAKVVKDVKNDVRGNDAPRSDSKTASAKKSTAKRNG